MEQTDLRKGNPVLVEVIRDGEVIQTIRTYNERVDAGAFWQYERMSKGESGYNPLLYIALSTDNLTPLKTHTTLSNEITTNGLARTSCGSPINYTAPTSLNGSASFQIKVTFNVTGTGSITVRSAALFDAASGGNMFAEANFNTAATVQNGDTLNVTWTITF